jgi:hypothetical protein
MKRRQGKGTFARTQGVDDLRRVCVRLARDASRDPDVECNSACRNLYHLIGDSEVYVTDSRVASLAAELDWLLFQGSYPVFQCSLCQSLLVANYGQKMCGYKLYCPTGHTEHKWFETDCTPAQWRSVVTAQARRRLALCLAVVLIVDSSKFFRRTRHTLESVRQLAELSSVRCRALEVLLSPYLPKYVWAEDDVANLLREELRPERETTCRILGQGLRCDEEASPRCDHCGERYSWFDGPTANYTAAGMTLEVEVLLYARCPNKHKGTIILGTRSVSIDLAEFGCSCLASKTASLGANAYGGFDLLVLCRCAACKCHEEMQVNDLVQLIQPLLLHGLGGSGNCYSLHDMASCAGPLYYRLQALTPTSRGFQFELRELPYYLESGQWSI